MNIMCNRAKNKMQNLCLQICIIIIIMLIRHTHAQRENSTFFKEKSADTIIPDKKAK